MIKFGSEGYDVQELQRFLNANGFNLDLDGDFGKNTLSALMSFQRRMGLEPTGVVDDKLATYITSYRDSLVTSDKSKVLKLSMSIPERFQVKIVAIRDYKESDGKNKFGVFDDAFFVISPNSIRYFKANTDPSRVGWNSNAGKPMAQLAEGLHYFIRGMHKQKYKGFRQPNRDEKDEVAIIKAAGLDEKECDFTVNRIIEEGSSKNYKESGYFAINIHPGGVGGSTSSEGCQTTPFVQFNEFRDHVYGRMDAFNQKVLPYLLVRGPVA